MAVAEAQGHCVPGHHGPLRVSCPMGLKAAGSQQMRVAVPALMPAAKPPDMFQCPVPRRQRHSCYVCLPACHLLHRPYLQEMDCAGLFAPEALPAMLEQSLARVE